LPTLLRSASHIYRSRPDVRFLVGCFKPAQQHYVDSRLRGLNLPIETHVGRTPEIIHLAQACVAVSGSVGLELLYQGKPSVVVYRIRPIDLRVSRWFITSRYISLVNLLAEKEIFPEFLTDRCEAGAIGEHVLGWLNDQARYRATCGDLADLRQRVAQPGACERAAALVLHNLGQKAQGQRRAA
jgi:lipid-A-disaccharide synthase